MENFVIVFLALLFFAGAVDNYSNYDKTEKRVRNIIPLKIKQKLVSKSIPKYTEIVIELQKLKITSQRKILRTQEANLTKCLAKLNSASLHDEIITQLDETIEQQKLQIKNQTSELFLRNKRIDELNEKIDQQIQNQSKLQQNQEHELMNKIENLANENKQKDVIFNQLKRDLDYEIESLKATLEATNKQKDRQEEIIAKLNQINKQQEYQIQNKSTLQQNQEHELTLQRNKAKFLDNENKQKDDEINQLKNDLNHEKLKCDELLDECGNENSEIKELSKQLEDEKLKNQKLLTQYKEKVVDLQKIKSANENCQEYFGRLEIEHGKIVRLVKDLETKNTELDSKYNQQTTESKNLISSNTQLSDNLTVCLKNLKQKSAVIPSDKLTCPAFGNYSATHIVNIENGQSFKIPCNSDESNLVWSVIERRLDQSLDFNRRWIEYREGFGDFQKEFFIGMEKLHLMTKQRPHQLLIRLRLGREIKFAKYSHFEIASEDENYAIRSLGKFSGDAGDGMRESEGKSFSTIDRDNDLRFDSNCAELAKGGWWFNDCGSTNLNYKVSSRIMKMVLWNNRMDQMNPIEMLIRPT